MSLLTMLPIITVSGLLGGVAAQSVHVAMRGVYLGPTESHRELLWALRIHCLPRFGRMLWFEGFWIWGLEVMASERAGPRIW